MCVITKADIYIVEECSLYVYLFRLKQNTDYHEECLDFTVP